MANNIRKLHPFKTVKTIVLDDSPKGWKYKTTLQKKI